MNKTVIHIFAISVIILASCESIDDSIWLQRSAEPFFVGGIEHEMLKSTPDNSSIRFTATVKLSGSKQELGIHKILLSKNKDMSENVSVSDTVSYAGSTVTISAISDVANDCTYYVQAEIGRKAGEEAIRSSVSSFTLGTKAAPSLSNISLSDFGYMAARVKVSDVYDWGYPILNMGILFSCNAADLNIEKLPQGKEGNYGIPFDSSIDIRCNVSSAAPKAGLEKGEAPTYYVRAYASNIFGTGYSDVASFSTLKWPALKNSSTTSTSSSANYLYTIEQDDDVLVGSDRERVS